MKLYKVWMWTCVGLSEEGLKTFMHKRSDDRLVSLCPLSLRPLVSIHISKEKWEEIDNLTLEQKCFWCYNLLKDLKDKLLLAEALE